MLVSNGWTGGQYSLFRAIFGAYLFVLFVRPLWRVGSFFCQSTVLQSTVLLAPPDPLGFLLPNMWKLWNTPVFVISLLVIAAGLSVLLTIGLYDRVASVLLCPIWICFFAYVPYFDLLSVSGLLLAHVFVPPAPYGSWAGRGRPDPNGSWCMPQMIYLAAWILLALGHAYTGFTKLVDPSWLDGAALARILENPLSRPSWLRKTLLTLPNGILRLATWGALGLELAFAPLALSGRLRPWLWGLMLAIYLSFIIVSDFADLSLGMVMLHLFTFDPTWVRPRKASGTEMLFYDGHCGLCHGAVRFILAEDRAGDSFHFAPLASDSFRAAVREPDRAALPDSLIVLTTDGVLLTRSAAVLHILRRLGGVWRLLSSVVNAVPAPVRDRVYDGIARVRYRLFRAPAETCPLVPADLRRRFQS